MGTTAKVFIVLNLIVAMFLGAGTLVLYAKKIDWVGDVKKSVDEANDIYSRNSAELGKVERERKELASKVSALSAENAGKVTTIEGLTESNKLLNKRVLAAEKETKEQKAEFLTLQGMLTKKEQRTGELQSRLDGEVRKNTASVKKMEWYQALAIEAQAELKEAENEMKQLAKSNAELVRRVTILTSQVEKYRDRMGAIADTTKVAVSGPPITGRVLQVEPELDLVILSVGLKDKVQKGMEFIISRGDGYISKVRISNVYDDMCSGTVLSGMTKKGATIKVSDIASTLD